MTCADEAHETCYDADQVAALVRDVADFDRWFAGQTGAICDTCHALLYYRHNVEAYLGGAEEVVRLSRLDQTLDTMVTYRIRRRRNLAYDKEFVTFMRSWVSGWEPKSPITGRPFDFRKHARSGPR